ncbi:FAD-dependent oxidoreductase [Mesorhizobium sangaii]|uniref:FAD-dependent oxidoreductase n=1 Tax=Mesorhizobium sangaii TaxID=505389 RepID=UPI0016121038
MRTRSAVGAGDTSKVAVIIVGGGGSGLFAAVEAAEMGRRVLVLEKNPGPGGTTNWAIGSLSSSGSPMQAAIGVHDTPEAHYEDMAKFHGKLLARDNPDLRRAFVEKAALRRFRKFMNCRSQVMQRSCLCSRRVPWRINERQWPLLVPNQLSPEDTTRVPVGASQR